MVLRGALLASLLAIGCRSGAAAPQRGSSGAQARAALPPSAPTAVEAQPAVPPPAAPSASAAPDATAGLVRGTWCEEGLVALDDQGTCAVIPARLAAPRRLVIYLHGTIPPDGGAPRRNVMSVVAASARRNGVVALMPRGRRGIGPNKIPEWWSWPTTAAHHTQYARAMVASWLASKRALEARLGAPFDRTYLAGSSNGAYFLAVLATKGEISVDGFAATSGGSGGGKTKAQIAALDRPPFYVGFGTHDDTHDPESLVATLKDAGWPHRAAAHKTGHGAREVYLDEALAYFGEEEARAAARRRAGSSAWCERSLGALGDDTCFAAPEHEAGRSPPRRRLLTFLHGVIEPGANTQWPQQRMAAERARARGFWVLLPRGQKGLGPAGIEGWWSWPTSAAAHAAHAKRMIERWQAARAELEGLAGGAFEQAFAMGFSNGGYFLSALALRGELRVDGFATVSGASPSGRGTSDLQALPPAAVRPFFVGFGSGDDTKARSLALTQLLRDVKWPHRVGEHRGAGHSLADAYFDEVFAYWEGGP